MYDRKQITRRWFFEQCGVGLGAIALGALFRENGWAANATLNPLAPRQPHFTAKAKRVIYLFMAGAPSHLELFDYKPALEKWNGKPPPEDLVDQTVPSEALASAPHRWLATGDWQAVRAAKRAAVPADLLPSAEFLAETRQTYASRKSLLCRLESDTFLSVTESVASTVITIS